MSPRRVDGAARQTEIIASAARLFREKGVRAVSIDDIVAGAGIAKGTFYLHFKTKDDLLEKLAEAVVQRMADAAAAAAGAEGSAVDRFAAGIRTMQDVDRGEHYLVDALNHPENSVLHDLTNVALVRRVAPVLAAIVEAGKRAGECDVEDPLATVEFLLAGQAALLGGGRFHWSDEETAVRLRATLIVCERALGMAPGALLSRLGSAAP